MKKAKLPKTNAARWLDQLGVAYRLLSYEVDPDDLSAESVAAKLGRPAAEVFKTLVARGDRHGPCFSVISGPDSLDLKALAAQTTDRRVELVPMREVLGLTGYVRGGVTVFGAKKAFPVYADVRILEHDEITVSAGQRGLQLCLDPRAFIRAADARVAPLVRTSSPDSG